MDVVRALHSYRSSLKPLPDQFDAVCSVAGGAVPSLAPERPRRRSARREDLLVRGGANCGQPKDHLGMNPPEADKTNIAPCSLRNTGSAAKIVVFTSSDICKL